MAWCIGARATGTSSRVSRIIRSTRSALTDRTRGNADAAVFERRSRAQEECLFERGAGDLETDRKPGRAEPARDGERRNSERVDSSHEPGDRQADVFVASAQADRLGADCRRGAGNRGEEETVHLGPDVVELAAHLATEALRVDIINRRKKPALIEKRECIRAEAIALLGRWLDGGRGFRQQDHTSY